MEIEKGWRLLRALVLAGALVASTGIPEIARFAPTTSVAHAEHDKTAPDDDDKKDNHNRGDDDDEDHVARGQVIGINTLLDPPELTLAAVDGEMRVIVLKTDEIALNGVKLCYHIRVDGEKIHEQLFEATKIEVQSKKKC
jgi:hypothetical protein